MTQPDMTPQEMLREVEKALETVRPFATKMGTLGTIDTFKAGKALALMPALMKWAEERESEKQNLLAIIDQYTQELASISNDQ